MPASEARIAANRKNAALSTGPKTSEGKEKSRANSFKHGLSGDGVVIPESDYEEVARRSHAIMNEMNVEGEVGIALARRAALSAVRMERAADQQTAAMSAKIRQFELDFVAPEGSSDHEAGWLRNQAVKAAMFDASPEAILARKYENAAERSFFRCIKELRQRDEKAQEARKPQPAPPKASSMASFDPDEMSDEEIDADLDAMFKEFGIPRMTWPARTPRTPGTNLPITAARPS